MKFGQPLKQKTVMFALCAALGVVGLSVLFSTLPKNHESKFDREELREWTVELLIPSILIVGGYLLNQEANKRQDKQQQAEDRRAQAEELARDRRAQEELHQQQAQTEFLHYVDRLSELVVDKGLLGSGGNSEAFRIAQALTANILRILEEERRNQVTFFLNSLKLSAIEANEAAEMMSIFRGMQLAGADLVGLEAAKANLELVDFSGADLTEVNFAGAFLREANLANADLTRGNLKEARLFKTDLSGAILKEADLSEAKLYKANLKRANLRNAKLFKANLSKANLEGANLSGAHLEGANFWMAQLEGSNFSEAHLEGANLSGAHLEGVNFAAANLEGVNFESADLWIANLEGAYLEEVNFKGADLSEANLEGADLWKANLDGAKLFETKLSEHLSAEQQAQCIVYEPILTDYGQPPTAENLDPDLKIDLEEDLEEFGDGDRLENELHKKTLTPSVSGN